MKSAETLAAAMRHHQAGRLAQAEQLYAQVLAAEPASLQALTLSGALALMAGRNTQAVGLFSRALAVSEQPDLHYNLGLAHWGLEQRGEAIMHWTRALALNPSFAQAHMNLGNALREEGRLDEAEAHLRRALQLQPSPFAHNNLGLALSARGAAEASTHYRHAIAMHPAFVEPYLNLALDCSRQGKLAEALALVLRSLEIQETPDNKALFVRLVSVAVADDRASRALVTRAAIEGWGPLERLAPAAATLLSHGSSVAPLIRRAEASWPEPAEFGLSEIAIAASEPLLRWLLESEAICDLPLERLLTSMRAGLLLLAETDPAALSGAILDFSCALARQCFINEYVYAVGDDECARAARLRDALDRGRDSALTSPGGIVAVVAAYFPLHQIENADTLLLRADASLVALIDQQVVAPRAEAACAAAMPRLTAIENDVSRLVQRQYEQNPYPRWIAAPAPQKYRSLEALLQRELPRAPFRPLGKSDALDILVAGCGTGRQSIAVARQFEHARVLAIDLSAASLGYAKVRTDALGVPNIEYAQADLLQLGSIGRSFDVIHADGVLHHLADPWAGFRLLLSLLRPNGFMHVSLYSELARRDVVAARAFIAERGYGTTPQEIRACRAALMAHEEGTPLEKVARFNDFFTVSECRDLLFHVQEHRMTLPAIRDFLAANRVQFLGFDLDFGTLRESAAQLPADGAEIDLDRWHVFEQDHPYAFASMYRLWLQQPER
jgi:2-polyprenyl-3-methyl-5-hydroxy-6-metoxy-1,4-benzoquinol methylase/Flp pilus assembly protein TadD